MNNIINQIIRVNLAGEQGAVNIYKTQEIFAKKDVVVNHVKQSLEEELIHLDYFKKQAIQRKIRPSLLDPIWKVGAIALGGISGILGKNTVMIATEAVEEVIVEHYKHQIKYLKKHHAHETDLIMHIEKFCQEEQQHKEESQKLCNNKTIGHKIFHFAVKNITTQVIKIAKKI